MAASRLINLLSAVLTCASIVPAAHAAEPFGQSKEPIKLTTDSSETDFRTGKTLMRNVTISQGEVSISAERAEATGMDQDDSRWEFSGNVKINAEKSGSLQSDRAIVELRNNRITRATVRGTPAQFEQKRAGSAETARGRAGEIVYEIEAGTVSFANDAWLSNGQNEISGPLLVYDIRQEKVQASRSPSGGERVQITIVPKDVSKAVKPDKTPTPDTPPPGSQGGSTP